MVRIALILILLMTGFNHAHAATATVVKVYNGDTLDINLHGERVKIRLYGIDAPESGQHDNVSSTRFLTRLLPGQPVKIEMLGTDRFGQRLAIVFLENKASSVNAAVVANGYAWVNPGRCSIDRCTAWKALESQARRLKLGIWSGFDLVPPWKFKEQQQP